MSHSRSSVVEIFKKELTPKKKFEIRKKMITMLENKDNPYSFSRIFDDCPCPLPSDEIHTITEEFKKLLPQIQSKVDVEDVDEISLSRKEDQMAVDKWINEITIKGIDRLLTLKGNMREDFINYFELKEFKSVLRASKAISSILSGFVSRVNQEVMYESTKEIKENQHSYSAFCNYLNDPKNNIENLKNSDDCKEEMPNNIKRIIKETMNTKDFILEQSPMSKKEKLRFEQIAHRPIEKPSNSSLMVLAAITAATAATSYAFFKKMKSLETQEAKSFAPPVSSSIIRKLG